jgi:FlaG/FlaF family flagellin (archaellin)
LKRGEREERREIMNFRKIRKNIKAVSPVISVLLMIVVAVAASLVTYAWVMGYLGFTTNKVGKAIQIQSIARNATGDVAVFVQNVGDSKVSLATVYINGTLTTPSSPSLPVSLDATKTQEIDFTGLQSTGQQITVKVATTDGTFIEYTKTFP